MLVFSSLLYHCCRSSYAIRQDLKCSLCKCSVFPEHNQFCLVHSVNVKKWEETVAEDERELEKLKKDEQKQMKVI